MEGTAVGLYTLCFHCPSRSTCRWQEIWSRDITERRGEVSDSTAPCRPVALSGDGTAAELSLGFSDDAARAVAFKLCDRGYFQTAECHSSCDMHQVKQISLPVRQPNNTPQLLFSCHFTLQSAAVSRHVASWQRQVELLPWPVHWLLVVDKVP